MNTSSSDNGPRWSKPLATYKTTVRTTNVQDRETRIAAKVIVTAVHPASAKVSNVSPDTALSHPPPYTSNGSTPWAEMGRCKLPRGLQGDTTSAR